MPIEVNFERFLSLIGAVAIITAMLIGGDFPIPKGWDKAAHFAAFSLLTLCLWHATAGQMPLALLAGIVLLAAMDEWRQAYLPDRSSDARDFLADFCAVLATGALLFKQRKSVCAESSRQ
jgi:VanZ family protein